jgi:hypothetical protein
MLLPTAALLTVLSSLPPASDEAEPPEERTERLGAVAVAVAKAVDATPWPGPRGELAALLVAQGYAESGFSRRIQLGQCRPRECDGGRAHGPWQIHRGGIVPWDSWVAMGQGDVEQGALYAARILASTYRACGSLEGAIGLYATGKTCVWKGAAERAVRTRRLEEKLGAALRERSEP